MNSVTEDTYTLTMITRTVRPCRRPETAKLARRDLGTGGRAEIRLDAPDNRRTRRPRGLR